MLPDRAAGEPPPRDLDDLTGRARPEKIPPVGIHDTRPRRGTRTPEEPAEPAPTGTRTGIRAGEGTGDGIQAGTGALGHEPGDKKRLLARLRRVEGQVRGLQRMVEEDRYCPDVLTQVAAVQASLRGAAEVLLHDHLRHCVTEALRSGDAAEAEAMYAELTDLFKKYGR